jgi:hypothetical protein
VTELEVTPTQSRPGTIDDGAVIRARLGAQQLDLPGSTAPEEAVRTLLAVQAQDFEPACWSIGLRTRGATADDVFAAFDEGRFLRTHILRPTWHLVHPDDLRWLLALTAPRVHIANGHMYRSLGLDAATLQKAADVVAVALDESPFLTRSEFGEVLGRAGVEAAGQRLAYVMMHAELEQVVCSGPRRGRTQTYALFDRRVPHQGLRDRDEALGELAMRFFAGHGPATSGDLKRWASLTVADVGTAIAAAGNRLQAADLDGRTYYRAASSPGRDRAAISVHLLQAYDEYISGFPESRHLVDATGQVSGGERLLPADILVEGRLSGTWRRRIEREAVTIEVATPRPMEGRLADALEAAAGRYAAFHKRSARFG